MSPEARAPVAPLPPRVRWLILAVAVAAVCVAGSSLVGMALDGSWQDPWALVGGALVAGMLVASSLLSVSVSWKGHRLGIHADEATLLAGAMLLPPHLVVVSSMLGCAVVEARRRTDPRKAVFNVASYTLAAAAAVWTYTFSVGAGLPQVAGAVLVPLVAVLVTYALLSQLFAWLGGGSALRILGSRFGFIMLASSVLGITLGASFLALYAAHPLAPLALVPLAGLAWQVARNEGRQDRELETRRALATMAQELVGCRDLPRIADSALHTCAQVFDCASVEIVLEYGHGLSFERERRVPSEGPADVEPLVAAVTGVTGLHRGALRVRPRAGARPLTDHDVALARAVAAATAAALETAGIIARLDDAHRRLDTYLNSSEDAILVVTSRRDVRFINASAARLLRAGTQDEAARRATLLEGAGAGNPSPPHWEATLADRCDDGKILLEVRATALGGEAADGELLVVARDVTERRRLEDVEAQQREIISRQERLAALGTLVAGVAHEVNNPLMYMRGCAELLSMDLAFARDELGARGVEAPIDLGDSIQQLERVVGGIARLETIARNLKSVAQGQRAPSGEVDVGAVVRRVADLVEYGLPPDVSMVVEIAGDLPRLSGDAGSIEQALLNLTKNAQEAMQGRRGRILLRACPSPGGALLEVSDEGPGIPEEDVVKLFTPFFTTKNEGTGLGLAFVHTVVQAHGGDVRVHSTPPRGTTFALRLPANRGKAPAGVEARGFAWLPK